MNPLDDLTTRRLPPAPGDDLIIFFSPRRAGSDSARANYKPPSECPECPEFPDCLRAPICSLPADTLTDRQTIIFTWLDTNERKRDTQTHRSERLTLGLGHCGGSCMQWSRLKEIQSGPDNADCLGRRFLQAESEQASNSQPQDSSRAPLAWMLKQSSDQQSTTEHTSSNPKGRLRSEMSWTSQLANKTRPGHTRPEQREELKSCHWRTESQVSW